MAMQLTDRIVKNLPLPAKGSRITYDASVPGFGIRVTAKGVREKSKGSRAFVLNYRVRATGQEKRFTIGKFPAWNVAAAREEAKRLKRLIDGGADPLGELETERKAETVADLAQRFIEQHLQKLRPSSQTEYRAIIESFVLPALGRRKVADVAYSDIDALHRQVTQRGARYRANRTVAILSKMFSLAIKWQLRPDNPAKGIERNQESKRQRFLAAGELVRLSDALGELDDQQAADIFRLLLLTGARRGEVMGMRWSHIQFTKNDRGENAATWTKPGATTKQKTEHRVPLSGAACALLHRLRETAEIDAEFVFPGTGRSGHRAELKKPWAKLRKTATLGDARIHDLRHTYASVLASAGQSLPIIGALLGHTQAATTARYAHLLDDPLRAATEHASAIIGGKPSAEIVALGPRRSSGDAA